MKLDFPIRTVVDYHVDRTHVEDPQGLELSVTNNPIVLLHSTDRFSDLLEKINQRS